MTHDLTALADDYLASNAAESGADELIRQLRDALRAAAAQDQKPVAWRTRWRTEGPHEPGDWSYYNQKPPQDHKRYEVEPLHLSPPPAAGWDEAIEACKKVAEKWLESFMGGEAYVARSIVNAIEALRHNAPPDSGAGKSEQPAVLTYTNYRGETSVRSIIPRSVRYGSTEWHPEPQWLLLAHDTEKNADREFALKDFGVPDHGGADAGVGETLPPLTCDFAQALPGGKLDDSTYGKIEDALDKIEAPAQDANGKWLSLHERIAALSHQPLPTGRFTIGFDGFTGDVIGHYRTREGVDGVVMQQDGTLMVHVYRSKHLKPAPVAANASAEARLREALENTNQLLIDVMHDQEADIRDRASKQFDKNIDALSAHPHASDCDKQEATKSEGIGLAQAGTAREAPGSATGCSQRPNTQVDALPSDRTTDVTETEIAVVLANARRCARGYDHLTQEEAEEAHLWPDGSESKTQARALLDAFTVGRR